MRVREEGIKDVVFTIKPELFPGWLLPTVVPFKGTEQMIDLCNDDDDDVILFNGD